MARQAALFNQPDLHQLRAPDPDRAQTVQAWIADPTGQAPATPADQASTRIRTPTPSIGVSDLIGAAITSTPSVSLNALTSFGRQLRAGLGQLAQPVQSRDGREQRPTERIARVNAPRPAVEDTRERVVTADTPVIGMRIRLPPHTWSPHAKEGKGVVMCTSYRRDARGSCARNTTLDERL